VHACERIACNAEWGPSLNQTTDVRLLAGFSFVSIDLVLYQVRSNYELTHTLTVALILQQVVLILAAASAAHAQLKPSDFDYCNMDPSFFRSRYFC